MQKRVGYAERGTSASHSRSHAHRALSGQLPLSLTQSSCQALATCERYGRRGPKI